MWPTEFSGSDSVWFLRLGHKDIEAYVWFSGALILAKANCKDPQAALRRGPHEEQVRSPATASTDIPDNWEVPAVLVQPSHYSAPVNIGLCSHERPQDRATLLSCSEIPDP